MIWCFKYFIRSATACNLLYNVSGLAFSLQWGSGEGGQTRSQIFRIGIHYGDWACSLRKSWIWPMADPRGGAPGASLSQTKIFLISCSFSENLAPHPPGGLALSPTGNPESAPGGPTLFYFDWITDKEQQKYSCWSRFFQTELFDQTVPKKLYENERIWPLDPPTNVKTLLIR